MEVGRDTMSYFDFAETDYRFFRTAYDNGIRYGTLASVGQDVCERYLKHIVDRYSVPKTAEECKEKESILRTQSLRRLVKYISEAMEIRISEETEAALDRIDGSGFATRYPGEDSFFAMAKDIEKANAAVECTRNETLRICAERSSLRRQPGNTHDFRAEKGKDGGTGTG